jgi:hypothetical protein
VPKLFLDLHKWCRTWEILSVGLGYLLFCCLRVDNFKTLQDETIFVTTGNRLFLERLFIMHVVTILCQWQVKIYWKVRYVLQKKTQLIIHGLKVNWLLCQYFFLFIYTFPLHFDMLRHNSIVYRLCPSRSGTWQSLNETFR